MVSRGRGEAELESHSMHTEFQSYEMKSSRDLLYNNMHTVNTTVLYT